jgi:cysteine desulfurase / selenocysteine lyase
MQPADDRKRWKERSMDWEAVYNAYPANKELIWLNNCGTTPSGIHILEAMSRFNTGYARQGVFAETSHYLDIRQRIKTILSALLNCHPDELALIHNTAEGMNFVSHGIDLKPEDEIVLLENEYPSNVYPWQHWQEKGVRLLFTPMAETPNQFIENFVALITPRTRLVSLSAVHWCSGMPLPLEKIGSICRKHDIRFVVDGAQGVGIQPIDVKKAGIDYMAFSAWKWLMGPLGLGVFYIDQKNLSHLKPIFIGTDSVEQAQQYLPYKTQLDKTADRFSFSTASLADWVYFLASLEFLASIGFDTIRNRIFELNDYLTKTLESIGMTVLSRNFPDAPTGITVCDMPGTSAHRLIAHLNSHGIIAAERLNRIRFSPHIYISPAQIDHVVHVISNSV